MLGSPSPVTTSIVPHESVVKWADPMRTLWSRLEIALSSIHLSMDFSDHPGDNRCDTR